MKIGINQCKQEKKNVVVKHVGKRVIVNSKKQMYRWLCMAKLLQ
jgi:hypothetical protein